MSVYGYFIDTYRGISGSCNCCIFMNSQTMIVCVQLHKKYEPLTSGMTVIFG